MEKILTVTTVATNDPDLFELFSNKIEPKTTRIRKSPDKNEECDDIAVTPAGEESTPKAVLAEVSGMVRRARYELAHGNIKLAAIALGRASDLIDCELNK